MKNTLLMVAMIGLTLNLKAQTTTKTDTTKPRELHTDSTATGSMGDPNVAIDANTDNNHQKVDPNQIYTAVQVQAMFPGGFTGFNEYIKKNQQLPAQTDPGKVIVQFVVEIDGTLSNIKILRSPGDVYSTEAIRLLEKSPKWKPAIQDGQPARSYDTAPIKFGDQ